MSCRNLARSWKTEKNLAQRRRVVVCLSILTNSGLIRLPSLETLVSLLRTLIADFATLREKDLPGPGLDRLQR